MNCSDTLLGEKGREKGQEGWRKELSVIIKSRNPRVPVESGHPRQDTSPTKQKAVATDAPPLHSSDCPSAEEKAHSPATCARATEETVKTAGFQASQGAGEAGQVGLEI